MSNISSAISQTLAILSSLLPVVEREDGTISVDWALVGMIAFGIAALASYFALLASVGAVAA